MFYFLFNRFSFRKLLCQLKYADNIERSDCECCNYYYHQQQQHQRGRRHNIIISKPKLGGNYP